MYSKSLNESTLSVPMPFEESLANRVINSATSWDALSTERVKYQPWKQHSNFETYLHHVISYQHLGISYLTARSEMSLTFLTDPDDILVHR